VKIFGREPAFWIGLIVTLILGVVQTLAGEGVISDTLAGRTMELTNSFAELLVLLLPLITGLLIRPTTTPLTAPSLPVNTPVLVAGTGDTPPPDAVVALRRDVRDPTTGRFRTSGGG
jgi:hypothetical protein